MESWYEGADKMEGDLSYYEFDPWFQADDSFIQEKAQVENMKSKEILEMWVKKQQQNSEDYKRVLQEEKVILAELKTAGFS